MADLRFRDGFLRYRVASVTVIVLGIALSVAAFFAIRSNERDVVRLTFEQRAQNDVAAINLAMERGLESVENSGALFDPGNEITSAQFQAFGERALARNPALKAVAWTPLVPANMRRAFEAAAQKDQPGYRVKELRGGPRAFLVSRGQAVPTNAEALRRLASGEIDPHREAVIVGKDVGVPSGPAVALPPVVVRRPVPEQFLMETDAPMAALLVVSEHFDPGWRATVDGRPAPALEVDLAARATKSVAFFCAAAICSGLRFPSS